MQRDLEKSMRRLSGVPILDSRIAVILPNYNMPEAADAIAEGIYESIANDSVDLYIVDNGSDLRAPALSTTLRLPENCQTTGGFLAGLAAAKKSGIDYIAYCFMITSTEWHSPIRFDDAIQAFEIEPNLVGYSPSLTVRSTTAWNHMKTRRVQEDVPGNLLSLQRATWMIDNICAFWRADWFDSIGWFDPHLSYAWGIDFETSWKARQQNKLIVIDDFWQVHKTTNIAYEMDRMNMTAEERVIKAGAEMERVLKSRYGEDWSDRMRNEFVTEDMR